MPTHLMAAVLVVWALTDRTRERIRRDCRGDLGASTLEMVVIALGLLAVAGILIAAITAAVRDRAEQLQ